MRRERGTRDEDFHFFERDFGRRLSKNMVIRVDLLEENKKAKKISCLCFSFECILSPFTLYVYSND